MTEFDELRDRVYELYGEGRFEEIGALIDGAVERFPDHRSSITYWQACIDSLLGDPEGAVLGLWRGAEDGMFWPENSLRTDPDLTAARSLPSFGAVLNAARRSSERANANRLERPEVLVFGPMDGSARGVLIGLHMYARTAAESARYWRPATEMGLAVAVPQSTQISGDGEPAWPDAVVTGRDARLAREEALERYPSAAAATIVGGASQGGARAAAIALSGEPFPCRGLIAVVSAFPDLPDVQAAALGAAARGLRAWLVTGDHDSTRDEVERLHRELVAAGVPTELNFVPGLGHEFPNDFPDRLRRAVAFVLDPRD